MFLCLTPTLPSARPSFSASLSLKAILKQFLPRLCLARDTTSPFADCLQVPENHHGEKCLSCVDWGWECAGKNSYRAKGLVPQWHCITQKVRWLSNEQANNRMKSPEKLALLLHTDYICCKDEIQPRTLWVLIWIKCEHSEHSHSELSSPRVSAFEIT